MARSPGQPKRPMTQRQLEVLAASNPTVAARMKEGFYKDRLREPGSPMPPAPTRRRAKTASIPADPGQTRSKPGTTRTGTGSKPGQTRTGTRSNPGKTRTGTGSKPGKTRSPSTRKTGSTPTPTRPRGFLGGLLGGG